MVRLFWGVALTLAILATSLGHAQAHGVSLVRVPKKAGKTVDLYKGSYALLIGVSNSRGDKQWSKLPGVEEDITVDDPDVAARHCALMRERGRVFVRDLGALSGTLVNGVPLSGRHKLQADAV